LATALIRAGPAASHDIGESTGGVLPVKELEVLVAVALAAIATGESSTSRS
jgi:hypothetical protein